MRKRSFLLPSETYSSENKYEGLTWQNDRVEFASGKGLLERAVRNNLDIPVGKFIHDYNPNFKYTILR